MRAAVELDAFGRFIAERGRPIRRGLLAELILENDSISCDSSSLGRLIKEGASNAVKNQKSKNRKKYSKI